MPDESRMPSAWQLEQSVATYQRQCERQTIDSFLVEDETTALQTIDGRDVPHPRTLLDRVIDSYVRTLHRSEEEEGYRLIAKERRDRFRRRCDELRETARDLLLILREEKRTAALARIALADAPLKAIITDPAKLPDALVRIERMPLTSMITERLLDGEVIEGATLSNPMKTVRITRHSKPQAQEGTEDE